MKPCRKNIVESTCDAGILCMQLRGFHGRYKVFVTLPGRLKENIEMLKSLPRKNQRCYFHDGRVIRHVSSHGRNVTSLALL